MMHKISRSIFTTGVFFFSISAWAANPCDLNNDGRVDATDVQAAINMSLGVTSCTANIAGSGVCNVIVVQRVVNASLGSTCLTSSGLHVVTLNWTAGGSNVIGYKVYRSSNSGGPYTALQTVGAVTTYTDTTVITGQTYYYVITSLDNTGAESAFSNQAQAIVTP